MLLQLTSEKSTMKQTDSILFKSGSWNCLTRGCIYANLWGKNVLATFEYKTESWGGGGICC